MRLTALEERAYEVIKRFGDRGVLQSELWKILGLDSKEGSRLTLRLLKKGYITREPVLHEGRKTYRITLTKKLEEEFSVEGFVEVPCFPCTEHLRCSNGGSLNPTTCPKLTSWLIREVEKLREELKLKIPIETLNTQ